MNRMTKLSVAALTLSLASVAGAQDGAIAVKDGGIKAAGWMGQIDPSEIRAGQKIENSKLVKEGNGVHVTTGPQGVFWESNAKASGSYTVKAKFNEPKFMNLMGHPHPYGLFIAGNDMGTENSKYLYCAAYGSGSFIMRGYNGPASFRLNGGRGEVNAAVNKAAGKDQPVTQEIAIAVKPDKVECVINGTVVGTYDKAALTAQGITTTDGVYGVRFGHNTEAIVTGLTMTKN
jgi:hypothetical protein